MENRQRQLDTAKTNYYQFMASKPILTNEVYLRLKREINGQVGLAATEQQTIAYLEQEIEAPVSPPKWVLDYQNAYVSSGHYAGSSVEEQQKHKRELRVQLSKEETTLRRANARINFGRPWRRPASSV
jgi:hypothetical protein